ncbi:LuxR C-terminal-related transcriptional regulator [Rhizobium sp. CNPSo 3464]|uniref:LuxR C-terminal-related transcriptional regulator n=1 Tax=Rhizobium sp. CNPSo 3464 TaxID=3021406 RepID=UPI0033056A8C
MSPRTVELHRSQVMNKLGAGSLTELGQIALAAGIAHSGAGGNLPSIFPDVSTTCEKKDALAT